MDKCGEGRQRAVSFPSLLRSLTHERAIFDTAIRDGSVRIMELEIATDLFNAWGTEGCMLLLEIKISLCRAIPEAHG